MKKIISFVLAAVILCAGLAAAGAEGQITIQDIMAANTMEAVLARHSNAAEYLTNDEGSRVAYADAGIRYEHYIPKDNTDGYEYEVIMDAESVIMYEAAYDMYYVVANIGLGYERKYTPTDEHNLSLAYDPEATALETVVDVRESGDALIVTTETEAVLFRSLERADYYPDDGVYVVEYTLDAKTLEIRGTKEYLRREDGRREEESEQTMMYDIALTDDISTMLRAMDLILKEQPQRTLTFILNPGTAEEKVTKVTVAAGVFVTFFADEKGYETFADPEGNTPWQDDYLNDQTIYVINPLLNSIAL